VLPTVNNKLFKRELIQVDSNKAINQAVKVAKLKVVGSNVL
jgi:hypothetical protein